MATLAFLFAAFADPVQAALVLAIVLAYRGPQPVAVAGATAAAVSETVVVLAADGYTWGELIAPRLVASLMQAALLVWIVRLVRHARPVTDTAGNAGRFADATRAAFGGSASVAVSIAQRLAPWHMRAYVRRRVARLRSR